MNPKKQEELEQIKDYEQENDNSNNGSNGGLNSSNNDNSNGGDIDEIIAQNDEQLQDKITKKESSANYHNKKADEATKEVTSSNSEEKPRSILKLITGFLLLFGALGSVMYFLKNKPTSRAFDSSVTEATEQGTEVLKPNSEPRTEPNQTEALDAMFSHI